MSGGPCSNGQALVNISSTAALFCAPGVFSDASQNVAVRPNSLAALTTGSFNAALGNGALLNNTTGSFNSAFGSNALQSNTDGSGNSALGWSALSSNTTGTGNSAIGKDALSHSAAGNNNSALGMNTMYNTTTGSNNSAFGQQALVANTIGSNNSVFGQNAMYHNTIGEDNAALGQNALSANTTGNFNSVLGRDALSANTTGSNNTAIGDQALLANTSGQDNVAVGSRAGQNLTTGVKNIDIGANVSGGAGESSTIRIGNPGSQTRAFIVGISGVTTGGVASPVLVDANDQLGTTSSSRRFKRDIHPLAPASRRLMRLHPISFRYKRSYVHGPSALQFGLLAEQVAKVYPNLVVDGRDGRPSAIAYQELPALLIAQAQRQQTQIAHQRNQIRALQTRLRGLGRLRSEVNWLMRGGAARSAPPRYRP